MNAAQPSNSPIKNSSLAIWSLVLGILGVALVMACVGPLFAIPAVICGHLALKRIKRSGGALTGEGLAQAGLIVGYVGLAIAVVIVPVMAGIAVPNFIEARNTTQRNICINNLRMIDIAKQQWALENNKNPNDVPTPYDLAPYIKDGFISLHCPGGGFYVINKLDEVPTCSISNHVLDFHRPFVPAKPPRADSRFTAPPTFNPRPSVFPSQRTNLSIFNTNTLMGRLQGQEANNRARCMANLRAIEMAKRTWARRNHKQSTDIPTLFELIPYLPGQRLPVCPSGGTYSFGTTEENPSCTITGHRLPTGP